MSDGASCERPRELIATPTILTKKASEAEADVNAVCVSKIQYPTEEVTLPDGKFCRREVLNEKRARLRQLFECDTAELDNSLRQTGYAFIPTQP